MNKQHQTLLMFALIASIISTSLHYTDNAIFINKYPEPAWITVPGVYISWILLTLIGIAGYWLYSKQKLWLSYLCLGIYSLTGLSSSAHYFYGAMSDFSVKMHTFIWLDVLTGTAVLGFVIWSGLILQEWRLRAAHCQRQIAKSFLLANCSVNKLFAGMKNQ